MERRRLARRIGHAGVRQGSLLQLLIGTTPLAAVLFAIGRKVVRAHPGGILLARATSVVAAFRYLRAPAAAVLVLVFTTSMRWFER